MIMHNISPCMGRETGGYNVHRGSLSPISDFVVYRNQPPYHAYSVRADNLQMKPAFTRIKEVKVNALTILNPNYLTEFCNYIGKVVIEFGWVHQPAF